MKPSLHNSPFKIHKLLIGLVLAGFAWACGGGGPVPPQTPATSWETKNQTGKPEKVEKPIVANIDTEPVDRRPVKLVSHEITLQDGTSYSLKVAEGFEISVAAEGLKRVRFFAKSPDGRYFVTDMYNLTDNSKGTVYLLKDFDAKRGTFASVVPYLTKQRNPNSLAFWTDKEGTTWLYLALTDKLERFKYTPGEEQPTSEPETLATFPDYGLSYKYGGWHLTRTIALGDNGKLYISVGSSCNSCEEKEDVRATVIEMDPDGRNQRIFATGLRNAVGLKWLRGQLWATNMGSDHLGDDQPEETLYQVREGQHYGWPYCFEYRDKVLADPQYETSAAKIDCRQVPLAYASFPAHSSPLGLEYFDANNTEKSLRHYFLTALHGSTKKSLDRGYRVVRVKKGAPPEDFITGFKEGETIHGRPCGILHIGPDAFLLTDDFAGVIYYVRRTAQKE